VGSNPTGVVFRCPLLLVYPEWWTAPTATAATATETTATTTATAVCMLCVCVSTDVQISADAQRHAQISVQINSQMLRSVQMLRSMCVGVC
jgi:hypothetical protein